VTQIPPAGPDLVSMSSRCQNCGNAAKHRPAQHGAGQFITWVCWLAVSTGGRGAGSVLVAAFIVIPFLVLSDHLIRGRRSTCGGLAFKAIDRKAKRRKDRRQCTAGDDQTKCEGQTTANKAGIHHKAAERPNRPNTCQQRNGPCEQPQQGGAHESWWRCCGARLRAFSSKAAS